LPHGEICASLQVREVAFAPQKRFHTAGLGSFKACFIQPGFHTREFLKVFLDEVFGFRQGQVGGARQAEGAHAIDQAEIDGFRMAALLLGHLLDWHTVDRSGGGGVDILPFMESLYHGFILGDMRHDPQFNLGVINCQELFARRGDETLPNAAPKVSSGWDVLQIRILRGDTTCDGACLVKCGVNPTGFGVYLVR